MLILPRIIFINNNTNEINYFSADDPLVDQKPIDNYTDELILALTNKDELCFYSDTAIILNYE